MAGMTNQKVSENQIEDQLMRIVSGGQSGVDRGHHVERALLQKIGRDVSAGDRMFGTASRPVNPELPVDQAHLSPHALARIPAGVEWVSEALPIAFLEPAINRWVTLRLPILRFVRFWKR